MKLGRKRRKCGWLNCVVRIIDIMAVALQNTQLFVADRGLCTELALEWIFLAALA